MEREFTRKRKWLQRNVLEKDANTGIFHVASFDNMMKVLRVIVPFTYVDIVPLITLNAKDEIGNLHANGKHISYATSRLLTLCAS